MAAGKWAKFGNFLKGMGKGLGAVGGIASQVLSSIPLPQTQAAASIIDPLSKVLSSI